MNGNAPRVFTLVGRALRAMPDSTRPHLSVDLGHHSARLSPEECRSTLYGPRRDESLWRTIWRQAAAEARQDIRNGTDPHRLLVVWLAIPGMNRSLYRILHLLPVDRTDLEAEAVLGVLTALDSASPDTSDTGGHLIRTAVNRMWNYAGRTRKEIPVVDVARFARTRNTVLPPQEHQLRPGAWELHVSPPPHPTGLFATIRFTESRRRLEGERLGALAHSAGLSELVFRARRHEEEELIGTLALHPAGERR
ncbi:hypothetical protein [Kitasatospora sp. NRRL B-11411]|uniref:hypothetical protein n=1 Tax=Kitasatospora sp. NRRL B-11411 TaxID=1463822 RepID=UPI0004C40CC2|nr:hypothetical protein [Kitasatospora sp. NRRL B-11411]